MSSFDLFFNYMSRSGFFTFVILAWLSLYFVITFGILFSRYLYLTHWLSVEKNSLESMLMGAKNVRDDSILRKCSNASHTSEKLLNVCKNVAEKNATSGLWMLSIIASTAPFIGLFGTVLGIIQAFHTIGSSNSFDVQPIMQGISEALIATATGLFVAIPCVIAYNYFIRRVKVILTQKEAALNEA